jgi:hypothetical protein
MEWGQKICELTKKAACMFFFYTSGRNRTIMGEEKDDI